jgi:glycerophosphoryl diester phosphodiesterase
LDRYSVIFSEDINKIFSDNSIYLVIDKLKDFNAIINQLTFANAKDRMLVEVFSYKDYRKALRMGIKYPMLCVWNKKLLIKHIDKIRSGEVTMLTIDTQVIHDAPELLAEFLAKGVTIFAFTSNDPDFIREHIGKHVTGFYTDTVLPSEIVPISIQQTGTN